mgnify:CR=1 FL=1
MVISRNRKNMIAKGGWKLVGADLIGSSLAAQNEFAVELDLKHHF